MKDPGPPSAPRGRCPPRLSDGNVSSRTGVEERKLREVLPLTETDLRMPLEGGVPIRQVFELKIAMGRLKEMQTPES